MENDTMGKGSSDSIVVKREPISRDNSLGFPPQTLSRHNSPTAAQPSASPSFDIEHPCSQESTNTTSTAPLPGSPIKLKGEEPPLVTPLLQDSPSNNPGSTKRRKRKSRRGRLNGPDPPTNVVEPTPPMRLTHANKHWFDIFQAKQSGQSVSTIATDHPPTVRIDERFNYVKEILQRSLGWMMLPMRWGLHWIAIYLLPLVIALCVLAFASYVIFPRYIFLAIPSVITTTTSILSFPARVLATKTPALWCAYVGIGCYRNKTEGEEVMRNATFATDLEVRNAFTVIHNLNYLNNSSNRLVLDSVLPLSQRRPNHRLIFILSGTRRCIYQIGRIERILLASSIL